MKIKLRLDVVVCPPATDEVTLRDFKRVKQKLKGMTEGEIVAMLFNAVERSIEVDRRVGFRP